MFLVWCAVRQYDESLYFSAAFGAKGEFFMQNDFETVSWDPALSIGQPRLDYDHKLFIGFFNEMLAHADTDVRSEFMSGFLDKFMRYVGAHFAEEERYMAEIGYPEMAAHVVVHHEVIERLTHIFELTILGEQRAVPMLVDLIRQGYEEHILVEDRKLAEFARARVRPIQYV